MTELMWFTIGFVATLAIITIAPATTVLPHWQFSAEMSGSGNEVFANLSKIMDRLCDTICTLTNQLISDITGREWIIRLFN